MIVDGVVSAVAACSGAAGFPADEIVDAAGGYVVPGFIDLHMHGAYEQAFDSGRDDLLALCRRMPAHGVTGFLPTLSPVPGTEGLNLLEDLAGAVSAGTQVLGFHFEGPYISLSGALPPSRLGAPGEGWMRAVIDAIRPRLPVFSVSPEYPEAPGLVRAMTENGALAFITHTAASFRQTKEVIAAGARHATHFYNVFPQPEAPEPGVRACGAVEAIMAAPEVSVDFILDGEHVDPAAVEMALTCKGAERVCLITDSMIGTGLPPGRFRAMGGDAIERACEGAPTRFAHDSRLPGALYGSGLTMDQALRNAVRWLGLDLCSAVRLMSYNPARVLGLEKRKGLVAEGFDADLVLLDKDLRVKMTWIGGRCCWPPGRNA
ncbi:MAG: amidohydrolase family protein [Planctomycetota bacterium]